MAITEKQIVNLKEKAQNARDAVIEAKATVAEVGKNIESYKQELLDMGVNPDDADEKVQELINEVETLFEEATEIASKWE